MEKYKGKKNFKEFFKFLSEQGRNDLYEMVDNRTICDFVESFYPHKLPEQYLEFMHYAGNGQFWVGSSYNFFRSTQVEKIRRRIID